MGLLFCLPLIYSFIKTPPPSRLYFLFSSIMGCWKGCGKMKWVLIVIFIFILLILLIPFTKLKIEIQFEQKEKDSRFDIKLKGLFGLFKYKIHVPLIKVNPESKNIMIKERKETGVNEQDKKEDIKKFTPEDFIRLLKDIRQLIIHVTDLYTVIRRFLKKVEVLRFEWNTKIGTGDAASTGVICGACWSAKGGLLGLISTFFNLKQIPVIAITPEFQGKTIQTAFRCMIQFRIGHAILAGVKLIKLWKGGLPHFHSKPLAPFSKRDTNSLKGGT